MHVSKVTVPLIACLLLAYLVGTPAVAYADGTIAVTTTQDEFAGDTSASCSLREAIEAVNIHNDFGGCTLTGTAPFTIQLGADTYTLSLTGAGEDANQTGDLDIHAPLIISGAGADSTIIQAGVNLDSAVDRLFHVMPTADVTLVDVTVTNGAPEPDGNGGGILNLGHVTINESTLANNRAYGDEPGQGGGALYNGPNSVATLNNTRVTMNQAITGLGNGGGILNGPNAILVINGGAISDNAAARAGGGIENNGGAVTFNNLSLNNNTAGINGGGLHTSGNGSVHMIGGEANNNVADAEGGALWNSAGGALTVEEAMIANNTASGADADQGGGGLFNDGGTLTVRNTTIMSNTADGAAGSGGGILAVAGSSVQVDGGVINGNHSNRAGGGVEVNGTADNMVHATLENVELSNNATGAAPGNGGALHITGVAKVTVSNATVTNNRAAAEGGGLWNSAVGTLTVIDSTLTGNSAAGNDADQGGGALFTDGGELTVIDTTMMNNQATGAAGSGGGILATVGSVLHVTGGMINDNSANRAGGGIEINATAEKIAYATLAGVELSGNNTGAAPGNGGALHITGPGQVTVKNATVTNNTAAAEGGGLWNSAVGTLLVADTTLSGNTASGNDADQGGGGLFNDGGDLTVLNSMLTGNVADGTAGSGGGILANAGSLLYVANSTLADNRSNRAGGGIEVNATAASTATVKLDYVDFTNNATGAAPGNGGALHITGPATVMINGGMVMGNRAAAEGGGFWNSAVGALTVQNVTLENNTASGAAADQGGGALFTDGGALSVFNATIAGNMADGASGSGGGILAVPGSTLEITGGTLISNTASRAGGAIELNGTMTDTVTATLNGVAMLNNMAGPAPGNGGALHITGVANVTVNGGLIMGNMATAEGGGLWNSAVGTLTVDGAKITDNTASGNDADQGGGGLFNDGGDLMVSNTIVRGNSADGAAGSGGGILNNGGTLTVMDSTIAGNRSNRAGGGVEDNAGELVRLQNVRLLKNSTGAAPGNGGALHITGAGTVAVVDSTVAENSAAAEGGGLWNSAVGTLTVSGTTLNKNMTTNSTDDTGAAAQGGGALFNDGGQLTVSNSTITGNMANNGNGGGLLNAAGTSTVVNVTVFMNDSSGIANATGTVNLANSLVAANGADCVGPISTNGAPNLDSDGSCGATITGDPLLGMLANNGGKTATLALLAGSPALDAGDNDICAAPPVNGVDQRGVLRPQGDRCDLGAYEAGAAATRTIMVRIAAGSDDAEETGSGTVKLRSRDLELVENSGSRQTVGLRFTDLDLPAGATVLNAYIQFIVEEASNRPTTLLIRAEATDDAAPLTQARNGLSSLGVTTAGVTWADLPAWSKNEQQWTPNLAVVIQEIVDRSGWTTGNDLRLVITGVGLRSAWSYDGMADAAPMLYVEYAMDSAMATSDAANRPATSVVSSAILNQVYQIEIDEAAAGPDEDELVNDAEQGAVIDAATKLFLPLITQ
ncbi:MAG: CSLREA domain-containing protein [Caldilineaceae bacterium]